MTRLGENTVGSKTTLLRISMSRWFNTAGPCQAEDHYMLLPMSRLPQVKRLIVQRSYFVIHAPRQIGKTTTILALAEQLNAAGQHVAAVLSVEIGAPFGDDIGAVEIFAASRITTARMG
jgi:hypothetical protein